MIPAEMVSRLTKLTEATDGRGSLPIGFDGLDEFDFRVAAAWQLIEKGWERPDEQMPIDDAGAWAWLWSGVTYDETALAIASSLDEDSTGERLTMMATMRFVRPDGTASPWFGRMSAAETLKRLRQDRAAKRPDAPPPPDRVS
jgi:hypothetical protein